MSKSKSKSKSKSMSMSMSMVLWLMVGDPSDFGEEGGDHLVGLDFFDGMAF